MNNDLLPVFSDWTDALIALVHALGGFKKVGARLRPELETKPESAAQWLRDCLNAEKRERLNPDQVLLLLRCARRAGEHAAKFWLDEELGYERGAPLAPEEDKARIQRNFAEAVARLEEISEQARAAGIWPLRAAK